MQAGDSGFATLFSVFNVDTEPINWAIDGTCDDCAHNCTEFADGDATPMYRFESCQSAAVLGLGESLSLAMQFAAPNTTGTYTAMHTIHGWRPGSQPPYSSWTIESTVIVSPSEMVPSACTSAFVGTDSGGAGTAGLPALLHVTPRDAYDNVISSYSLAFRATATCTSTACVGGGMMEFESSYNFEVENAEERYVILVELAKMGTYTVTLSVADGPDADDERDQIGSTLFGQIIESVVCEDVSSPNVDGNACECSEGYARLPDTRECGVCDAGFQPKADAEQGCVSCMYTPGSASASGIACVLCDVGLQPSGDFSQCIECPANQYFLLTGHTCASCEAGMELSDNPETPCVMCDSFSFGTDGTCSTCADGKQPMANRLTCATCPIGTAGTGGECLLCPPGTEPNTQQTACDICLPGYYRGEEAVAACLQCPLGMTSDIAAESLADCMCPEGTYHAFDSLGRWSPIWCWVDGLQSRHGHLDENKESLATAVRSSENAPDPPTLGVCATCPACIDCGAARGETGEIASQIRAISHEPLFDPRSGAAMNNTFPLVYRGRPFVVAGWTMNDPAVVSVTLPPGESSLSMTTVQTRHCNDDDECAPYCGCQSRDVFRCPYDDACIAEVSFRNGSIPGSVCNTGFRSYICATCEGGYIAGKTGCSKCGNVKATFVGLAAVVTLVCGIFYARKKRTQRQAKKLHVVQQSGVSKYMGVFMSVVPTLLGDVRVFIGVYQTLTQMGSTLSVTFPASVEQAIFEVKGMVNFDIFSFASVSCIASTNYYGKLWAAVLLPAAAELVIYYFYTDQLFKANLNYLPDPEKVMIAHARLEEIHRKQRMAKAEFKNDWTRSLLWRKHRKGSDRHKSAEEDAAESHARAFEHDKTMRKLYSRQAKKAEIKQATVSWAFFVIFMAYPQMTSKIFDVFYCYTLDNDTAVLMADLSVSCTGTLYYIHWGLCIGGVIAIPVGIPACLGLLIWRVKKDIIEGRGPHHLETLYTDYKPECCMWEVWQMLQVSELFLCLPVRYTLYMCEVSYRETLAVYQKVSLIGLLTFIDRGSILQCLVGLIICNFVLVVMINEMPYVDQKTNILSITGQFLVVLSFLSALLLRVDLSAEMFTVDMIGTVILAANVPMLLYLTYDTIITMRDELHAAPIDMLQAEMGGENATYVCLREVQIQPTLGRNTNLSKDFSLGTVKQHQQVTALEQGFTQLGTARLRIDKGWVSFCAKGGSITAERYFVLVKDPDRAKTTGKVKLRVDRTGSLLRVTIICAKGLKDMDLRGGNDDYVIVRVNGEAEQRTGTLKNAGANPIWNNGAGETLEFPDVGPLRRIHVQCYDEDKLSADDLIGECTLPLDEIVDGEKESVGDTWWWEGWRVVRESTGELAKLLPDAEEPEDVGNDEYANPMRRSNFDDERGSRRSQLPNLLHRMSRKSGPAEWVSEPEASRASEPSANDGLGSAMLEGQPTFDDEVQLGDELELARGSSRRSSRRSKPSNPLHRLSRKSAPAGAEWTNEPEASRASEPGINGGLDSAMLEQL